MHCRKCKRNGKDVEMVKWLKPLKPFPEEIRASAPPIYIPLETSRHLKCPECGWSVSV